MAEANANATTAIENKIVPPTPQADKPPWEATAPNTTDKPPAPTPTIAPNKPKGEAEKPLTNKPPTEAVKSEAVKTSADKIGTETPTKPGITGGADKQAAAKQAGEQGAKQAGEQGAKQVAENAVNGKSASTATKATDTPNAPKAPTTEEKDSPTKRRGRQPTPFNPKVVEHNTVKSDKDPQAAKSDNVDKPKSDTSKTEKPSEKPNQGDKTPKAPKDEKAANVGSADGKGVVGNIGDKTAKTVPTAPSTPNNKTTGKGANVVPLAPKTTPSTQTKAAPTTPDSKKAATAPTKPDTPTTPTAPTTTPTVTPPPEPPRDATRSTETETIVYINHADLHPFKDHPFQVRNDDEMKNLVASIKERGVDQAALVRPRPEGGYELVAGHRRRAASEMAGIKNVPCVVRKMTDEEAILAMTESNFNQRSEILPSERAQGLKMQLDAIKKQGERFKGVAAGDIGKRSNEIVAEKNKMSVKTMQRHIALNNLTPDLMKLVDDKKISSFMVAFEMSYIQPKNQNYIAMTIEAQEKAPALAQAQRMRELDSKGVLNGDVIDGILLEENKKEDRKVIITGQELDKYFGADKTPKEMKDTILKLLDEYKAKQPQELGKGTQDVKNKPPER